MGQGRRAFGLSAITHILWRVLFAPGHDACRLTETKGGAVIDGTAVFVENTVAANLRYRIECDATWATQQAVVSGWIGERDVDVATVRTNAGWQISGAPVQGDVAGLLDVDLGFTPATNTNAIRRFSLDVGQSSESTALWFDVDNWAVKPLRQTYRRLDVSRYEYTSPDHAYRAVLSVNGAGMVTDYPDLWAVERSSG